MKFTNKYFITITWIKHICLPDQEEQSTIETFLEKEKVRATLIAQIKSSLLKSNKLMYFLAIIPPMGDKLPYKIQISMTA